MMQRRILHLDMDAFFASVEQARHPEFRGRPVIVGGLKTDTRGVVSAASYEARQYGVRSAMPLAEAKRLCPDGVYVRGDHARYREVSRLVRQTIETVSPLVQMASIDEAYVDVTGSQRLFGGDDAIGAYLKREIRERTLLPCTIAIAPNKLVAKVAAELAKPDGYRCVKEGQERALFASLAVGKLPGAGPRTVSQLEGLGIYTLGQLADFPLTRLEGVFGAPAAMGLHRAARGESDSPVSLDRSPKQISRETTFARDERDWRRIEQILSSLMERCVAGLREQGLEAKRVGIKVRYNDFDTRTFAATLPESASLECDFVEALKALVPKAQTRTSPVRLVGVQLGQLRFNQHQIPMFDRDRAERWERLMGQVDALRSRHGFDAMHFGRALAIAK